MARNYLLARGIGTACANISVLMCIFVVRVGFDLDCPQYSTPRFFIQAYNPSFYMYFLQQYRLPICNLPT